MKQPIPYAKMSKKAQKAEDARKRGTWGALNPTTRKTEDGKKYTRKGRKKKGDE